MTDAAARPDLDLLLAEAGWVRALAHSLLQDPATADDVVQETWIAVLRRPPRTDAPVRPWLKRVVENFVRMRRRGEASRATREESSARGEALASTADLVARVETQRLLAQEVLALDEPFRTTIVLRYYEGLSAAEIARRVGAPAGTVRWRLMRGLALLRERLDHRHGGERTSWVALLVPLSRESGRAPIAATVAAGGALARVLGWLLLLLGAALWWLGARRGGTDASRDEPPGAALVAGAADVPLQRGEMPAGEREFVALARASVPTSAAEPVIVLARIVDASRSPIAGAQLALESGELAASADEIGWARLVLVPTVAARAELATFEARAPGFAPTQVDARLARDSATYLGEIALARAGALEGFVGAADGRPLAGARVRAESAGRSWAGARAVPFDELRHVEAMLADAALATTDERGRFRFAALPAGYVRVWAHADGFTGAWTDDVAVLGGETATAPDFALAAPPQSARIAGVVLDPRGAPAPFAELECARLSKRAAFFRGERFVIAARADELGRFDFGVDPQSRYDLAARDAEARWCSRVLSPVAPGTRELVVALAAPRPIEIDARDAEGRAVAPLEVRFFETRLERELERESEAVRGGVGFAPHVAFSVRVGAPGFAALELGPFEPDDAPAKLACTLRREGGLVCVVRAAGQPVEGARAELWPAPEGGFARPIARSTKSGEPLAVRRAPGAAVLSSTTDVAGRCVFDVPRAANYLVRVEAAGSAPALIGPLALAPAAQVEQAIELGPGGALEGRVVRVDGAEAAGTVVGLSCGDGWLATQRVGVGGAFRFDGLAPGAWQVREVFAEAREVPWQRLELDALTAETRAVAWDAEVVAGATARFDLVLGERDEHTVRGQLLFDGASPGGWQVELSLPGAPRSWRTTLDPRGEFELRVPRTGRYELLISCATLPKTSFELRDEVQVTREGAGWSLALDTANVRARATPLGEHEVAHWTLAASWRGRGALQIDAVVPVDAAGRAELARWPAGSSTLELSREGSDDVLTLEVELRAGETREVRLGLDRESRTER